MTATERVRELLDERGVKYRTHGTTDRTWFEVGDISWFVVEHQDGDLTADAVFLAPEQAIDVTLGSCNRSNSCTNGERTGTCHLEINTSMTAVVCDRCNYPMPRGTVLTEVRFCPNCGRKVVDA